MKKKLLCMLLSIAMVSTAPAALVLAAERPTELRAEINEAQGEISLFKEGSDAQTDFRKEQTESDAAKDTGTGTESDPEKDTDTEKGSESAEKDTDTENNSKSPEKDTNTENDSESPEKDTDSENNSESPEKDTDTENDSESDEESTDPENDSEPPEKDTDTENDSESAEENTETETGTESAGETTDPEKAADDKVPNAKDKTDRKETDADTELQAEYHSIDEITEFLNRQKADKADAVTYAEEPNLSAPYHAGALSDTTLESAAAIIRQIRFIAGLPYDMNLNNEYNYCSQAAALLSYVNHELSQEPSQPEGMSDDLFKKGCEGAANSGLAYTNDRSQTLNGTILDTWMAGHDGHSLRGQLLKPSMEQIGVGAVKGGDGMYGAIYTADHSGKEESVFGVAWPARNMPVDYFDREYPWSVSTGETLNTSDIQVTLTRKSDKKKWIFSKEKSDGLFSVDNDTSGQSGCIIFRPEPSDISEYADGDIFEVEITKDEKPYLHYRVQFFALSEEEEKLTAPEASIAAGETVAKDTRLVLTSREAASVYYTFDGTAPTSDSALYTEPIIIDADVTVTAIAIKAGYEDSDLAAFTYSVEEDIPVRYTVTFESDGGTIIPAQSIAENEKVIIPEEPTKEGCFFEGWYQEADHINIWNFETDIIESDITLYAKWNSAEDAAEDTAEDTEEKSDTAYIVTYDMQGIGEQIEPETVNKGELLTKPDVPTVEGYTFSAWYQEPECINPWDFETDMITQDTILYAKWTQEKGASVNADDSREATVDESLIDLSTELTDTQTNKIPSKVYNGKAYEPSVKVTVFNGKKRVTLKKNKDYTLKYANNIHAGVETASVTISGIGKYTGSVTKKFTITPKNIKKLKIITGSKLTSDRTVSIVIYDGTTKLNNGLFLAEYIDAQDPKKAKITITPKATTVDYTGSVTSKLTVYDVTRDKYINSVTPEITGDTLYTGKAITRNVKIKIGDIELRNNKDYKVQYQNNVNAGTAVMIITGKGQYKGKIVSTFNIGKVDLNKKESAEDIAQHVTIADITPKVFNGKEQKPAVIIKTMRNKKLALNKDYTAIYSNNIHAGTATITIAGIGNNCNGKTTIKFKIEPQQIKKAAVKLIKGKDGAPNTIALTYNKTTLREYADYIITEYGEMKNKKIPVTIEGRSDFTGNVTKQLNVAAPEDDPGSGSAAVSKNINRQNYGSYEGCIVHSYLQKNDDDTFMRVEHTGQNNVCIESYSSDYKFIDKKTIKTELPKFGGFYSGKDYYFLVFGQDNPKEDNTVEVIRIVKYDKNWERLGSVGIFGGNTVSPFKNGSLRMVEYENTLFIRTCHQMYRSSDGKQHQANVAISIDIPSMEILEQYLGIHHSAYCSHSFNQFVLIDDSILLTVDHGDAYPRAVSLAKYGAAVGTPGILGKGSYSVAALSIQGGRNNPATGVSVGGFEASDTAYLTAGNSVEQNPETYTTGGVRNIYVTSTQKDNFTKDGNTVHWITDHKYIEYTDANGKPAKTPEASVSTPQLVKISGSEMMLLWTESTIAVENSKPVTTSSSQKCVLLNGAGEPISGIYSFDGPISDCKPIVNNGNLLWYYTNNTEPVFCTLNISDVRNQPK